MPTRRIIAAENRKAGAEVEFNGAHDHYGFRHAIRSVATVKQDGSCGEEAVTRPLSGAALKRGLEKVILELRKARAYQDGTCGTHVHVDVSDYDWKATRRLCLLYAHVEPLLYLIAGQHRANNWYCRPNGKFLQRAITAYPDDPKSAVLAGVYYHGLLDVGGLLDEMDGNDSSFWCHPTTQELMDRTVANLPVAISKLMDSRLEKHHSCRYVGMNLCPMFSARTNRRRDCTVEFRMHRETMDAYRLTGWTSLLVQMVSWARRVTDIQLESALRAELDAAKLLSNTVAPDSKTFIRRRIREFNAAVTPRNRRIHYSRALGFTMNESRWAIGQTATVRGRWPREPNRRAA